MVTPLYLGKASGTRESERTPSQGTTSTNKTILGSQDLNWIPTGSCSPKTGNIQDFTRILNGRSRERVLKGFIDDGAAGTVWVSLVEGSFGRQGHDIYPQVLLLLVVFHRQVE